MDASQMLRPLCCIRRATAAFLSAAALTSLPQRNC